MTQVFISYASEDRRHASLIASTLVNRGWDVWWDRELVAGSSFDEVIEQELDGAAAVIVLWSPKSLESDWVRAEAASAVEREVLIPILIGGSRVPLRYRNLHTIDLSDWNGGPEDPRLDSLERALVGLTGRVREEAPDEFVVQQQTPDRDDRPTESVDVAADADEPSDPTAFVEADEVVAADEPVEPVEADEADQLAGAGQPDRSAPPDHTVDADPAVESAEPEPTVATEGEAVDAAPPVDAVETTTSAPRPEVREDERDLTLADRLHDRVPEWMAWWHPVAAAAVIVAVVASGVFLTRPDPDPIVASDPPVQTAGTVADDGNPDDTNAADTTDASPPDDAIGVANGLGPDEELSSGEFRTSPNGRYTLVMQTDGNLALIDESYSVRPAIWSTNTFGNSGAVAVMQEGDGNFVVYAADSTETDPRPLFSFGTDGNVGASLIVTDDGKVVVRSASGEQLADSTDGTDEFPIDVRSTGPRVAEVQRMLVALGFDVGSSGADGRFGPTTDAAVREWQSAANRERDGVIDRATWNALRADANPAEQLDEVNGCVGPTDGDEPCEGELVRVPNDIAVYLVERGVLRRVPDIPTLECFGGFPEVRLVSEDTIDQLPVSGHPATCADA